MCIPDEQPVKDRERPAGSSPPAKIIWSAGPWRGHTDVPEPVFYDKIDRRLMDTFPASDAVAQY